MIRKLLFALLSGYLVFAAWWVIDSGVVRRGGRPKLLNVACDPTRELWRDLNAQFIEHYRAEHGISPLIRQSHGGSGSQARAIIDGLDADVATLALWTDTDAIRRAGRLRPDWEAQFPNRSLPFTSTIVFVVRKGNPKQIRDWPDLARSDVAVVVPNPKTSGNGKWSLLAMWGSVVRRGGNADTAERYLRELFQRVPVLDPAARGATMTFSQKRIGDVHLTWENEAHLEVQESQGNLEIVYPPISIMAEPHIALIDRVTEAKGTTEIARSYLMFLYSEAGQEIIAKHYYRPTRESVRLRTAAWFPQIELFTVRDLDGDWDAIHQRFFAEGGLFDRIYAERRRS